jgi:hypothetical protein
MYTVTPVGVFAILVFYAALLVIFRMFRSQVPPIERKTFIVIGGVWGVSVFVANYLLFRAGVMSYMPWLTNGLHTFVWIGICLATLYLAVRTNYSMATQFVLFATLSLIVKYAEQRVFGTWDLDHFFHVVKGNWAYVLGWSLADGLYPMLTRYGLRLAARGIPGIVTT